MSDTCYAYVAEVPRVIVEDLSLALNAERLAKSGARSRAIEDGYRVVEVLEAKWGDCFAVDLRTGRRYELPLQDRTWTHRQYLVELAVVKRVLPPHPSTFNRSEYEGRWSTDRLEE